MRCTSCSEVVKPVVALDIDGTLGDYHDHFLTFAELFFDRTIPPDIYYDGSQEFKWWCSEVFGINEAEWKQCKLAYRQGGMKRSMPAFGGAENLCQAIRDAGAELWLTTTRPYLRLDNIDPDTREWCRRNHIEFDGLLFDKNKYEVLAERVDPDRVVLVLDDLAVQVSIAARVFGERAYLRATNYNRVFWGEEAVNGGRTFITLKDVEDYVIGAINQWKANHYDMD